MNKNEKLSVFGLGKLGCTMLACFAHKGWGVIGMDINKDFTDKINEGLSPIYEPGVSKLIKDNHHIIEATTDAKYAVENSDVSFVIVPTPSTEEGYFTTRYVETVASEIGSILRTKEKYHLIVITSTVLPGDMTHIVNLLERTSQKKVSTDFGVCYNPDFIALGSIVKNFLNPDMVLIGESDKKAGNILEEIHHALVDNTPIIHRMNFYNAELTKIALNSYCTLKITFANVLAEICEHLPGGDVDVVTNALGDDTRIGRKYLKGGLSYGGPCFPRDNRAFSWTASKVGIKNVIAQKTDEINNYHRNIRIPQKLIGLLKSVKGNKIAILGLTYKADTTLIEESAAIYIIKALYNEGIEISVYDPAGMPEAKTELSQYDKINYAENPLECLENADLCFIASPWSEFKLIPSSVFISKMKHPVLFDAWNLFNFDKESGIEYNKIGIND